MCFNLIQQIEAKSAQLDTERVWNAPWPTLNVTYRNVTKVYFRAVAVDFDDYITRSRWNFGGIDDERRKQILGAAPALEWNADLPPTKDFKPRTEKLPAPTTLKPGFYFIVASHDRLIWRNGKPGQLRHRLGQRSRAGDAGRATTANRKAASSSRPTAAHRSPRDGRIWQRDREGWFKPVEPVETDENGRFQISAKGDNQIVLLAEHDGQAVSSIRRAITGETTAPTTDSQTVFFTDRALYRPGQTINYKGIAIRYDQSAGKYSAIAGLKLTVVVQRSQRQGNRPRHPPDQRLRLVQRHLHRAARPVMGPHDHPSARWPSGTSISVEEYKRPKFQVELNAPAEAAKLGAPVNLTGKATAYTGAAIGGAKVKWRVERGVQCPYWCWWWQPAAPKAIAHGTAVTEADGTFKIQFTAEPDRAVPVKNEPTFVFTIHADVTDTTGETRSGDRTVRAGYTALQASLIADEWQTPDKPVEFTVATKSLDGDPQPANGTVTIYALKQPAQSSARRATPTLLVGKQRREPKADPSNPDSWELGRSSPSGLQDRRGGQDAGRRAVEGGHLPRIAGDQGPVRQRRSPRGRTVQVVDPRERITA
jgi:opacity protein-like surface antigen